jgi:transcriptional regulator with XRE-family HTH domain
MKTRIKELRKSKNLTQVEFGEKIGVKGNTVTNYETGLRNPTDAVVLSICREFGVNEEWLRTGKGEMFSKKKKEDEISYFFSSVTKLDENDFKKRLVSALAKLDQKGWDSLEKLVDDISN